jgi:hypothetical protein
MTVDELIQKLQGFDGDSVVIVIDEHGRYSDAQDVQWSLEGVAITS